jgi:hypothetical protein
MYDNQMFDNVFFSVKQKREIEVEAANAFKEALKQYDVREDFVERLKQNEVLSEQETMRPQII